MISLKVTTHYELQLNVGNLHILQTRYLQPTKYGFLSQHHCSMVTASVSMSLCSYIVSNLNC
jgi:hypothetical protein